MVGLSWDLDVGSTAKLLYRDPLDAGLPGYILASSADTVFGKVIKVCSVASV